jgi:hypothetical protein
VEETVIDKPSDIIHAVDDVVDSAFSGLDSLFTSDEERGQLKLATDKLKAGLDEKMLQFREFLQAQYTARHAADMKSDSWLAKNIRPLTLLGLTVFTFGYLIYGMEIDLKEFGDDGNVHPKVIIWKAGLGALLALDTVVYGFYFGSRGLEKITDKIPAIVGKLRAAKKRPPEDDSDLGW